MKKSFDIKDIRGTVDQGITDEALWQKSQQEKRLLITTDKGFSSRRDQHHYGLLIIRLKQPTRLKIHHRIMQAIKRYSVKDWPGQIVVMRDTVQSTWKSKNK